MNVRVEESDGKLTLEIPEEIVANLHLSNGSIVDVSLRDEGVVLRPVASR